MESKHTPLTIAFSSDAQGLPRNATVIASVLRRTTRNVWIRFYCRDFLENSFTNGRLQVEFLPAGKEQAGNYPAHVGAAVFDRMKVIADATDWDRCLVMDHDMLALCDMAPYFEEDFEGNLLMGRMFGPGNTLGLQMQGRGGLPRKLRYAAEYPYFYMGPMMNLKAMRKARTWNKLLWAHKHLQQEEQMALTIATEGKVKAVSRMWNLVPHWDHLELGRVGPEKSGFGTVGEAALWKNGLPQGVIHWTGWAKPWHPQSQVWRPDLWEGEETNWEALRRGWWKKPRIIEIFPENAQDVTDLALRGWKVDVVMDAAKRFRAQVKPHPDVAWFSASQAHKKAPAWFAEAEMIRFGPGQEAPPWLEQRFACKNHALPLYLILQGPCGNKTIGTLRKMGYRDAVLIERSRWAAGGPAPAALDYDDLPAKPAKLLPGMSLYLRRATATRPARNQ